MRTYKILVSAYAMMKTMSCWCREYTSDPSDPTIERYQNHAGWTTFPALSLASHWTTNLLKKIPWARKPTRSQLSTEPVEQGYRTKQNREEYVTYSALVERCLVTLIVFNAIHMSLLYHA